MPARSKFLTASPETLVCFARASGNFAGRPRKNRRSMDAFSEVLSGVRLKGAMFFSAEFSAPWRLSTPHGRMLAPALAPGAPHIVVYHFVVEGTARARVDDGPDIELSPGDIVVFPHGDPHHLSVGPGTNPVESGALLQRIVTGDLSPMQAGGGG